MELREAIYQCAPFIGFPKTLNAVAILNEVFRERGIDLPLPDQATTTEEDRFEAGWAIQAPIYGGDIADSVAGLSEQFREAVPRFLTEFGFGDFYTRTGLDVATRELLLLCVDDARKLDSCDDHRRPQVADRAGQVVMLNPCPRHGPTRERPPEEPGRTVRNTAACLSPS